jgi:outer membrane receptor protein involved in Fe transport
MLTAILLIALPLLAQLPTGTILGVVKDTSGAVIPGATVTIRNMDTGMTRTATTGNDGEYRVPALAVGTYEVRAEHAGFETEIQRGLTLNVSEEVVVNAELKIGTTQQEVMVTGEAPLVNTTSSVLGGLVSETKLADLPLNGRNYADLALLQTGIAEDRNEDSEGVGGNSGTWYSSNGAPPRSNNYILDGAQLSNLYGGNSSNGSGTTLGVDGIQEYKLLTNSFSAEYGQTMGSQMAMVSKGGTNQWHGDGFEYFRNSGLDARNFFDYSYQTPGAPRLPTFQRNNFGGSFGGPIKKDNTFFYAVYEGLRLHYGTTAFVSPDIPAACFNEVKAGQAAHANPIMVDDLCTQNGLKVPVAPPMIPLLFQFTPPNLNIPADGSGGDLAFSFNSPTSVNYGQIRVDHTFSAKDSIFVRYTVDQNDELITSGGSQANAGASFPNFYSATPGRDQFLSVGENHIFSQSLLNAVRLSGSRTDQLSSDAYGPSGPPTGPTVSFTKDCGGNFCPVGDITVGNVPTLGSDTQLPNLDIQNIITLGEDLYWTKGKHALKFGVLLDRYELGLTVGAAAIGSISFNDYSDFLQGIPASYLSLSPTSSTWRHYTFWTVGVYGQDDYRVNSRLTLNLGLRYEIYTAPNERNNRGSNFINFATASNPPKTSDLTNNQIINNASLRNIEPRFGFAYDLTGNGKMSLRGAFGIFYDIANIGSVFQQSAQGTPPISVRNTFNPQDLSVGGQAQTQYLYGGNPGGPFVAPFLSYPAAGSAGLRLVDYQNASPHILQYNLTLDRQLPKGIGLTVSYVGSRGIDLWYTGQVNYFSPTAFTAGGAPIFQPYLCAGVASVINSSGCKANPAFQRLNPNYGSGTFSGTGSESWYNSLQLSVVKRLSAGLEFQAAYTYSHSLDTTSGQMSGGDCRSSGEDGVTYSGQLVVDKGPSCSDLTHNVHFNLLYHFPDPKMNGFGEKLLNGWWMGNIVTVESGLPFNPILSNLRSFGGSSADRPMQNTPAWIAANPCTSLPGQPPVGINPCAYIPIPFDSSKVITGDPNQWFNPAMFSLQPVGQFGTGTRGMLRGPGLGNWDFSLAKDTPLRSLGERGSVEFRAEFFNFLNRANFGQIPVSSGKIFKGSTSINSATGFVDGPFSEKPAGYGSGGAISSTSTTSRQIQLALKFIF